MCLQQGQPLEGSQSTTIVVEIFEMLWFVVCACVQRSSAAYQVMRHVCSFILFWVGGLLFVSATLTLYY